MKKLFKSLADFQQEVPVIHKATQGYGYTYADLPKILEVINPLLKKHGLGFTQLLNSKEGQNYLSTILFHVESGESMESNTLIPQVELKQMNLYQSFGSGCTYFRRYCLSSILGIVTDKDTDAGGEQVKHEPKKLTLTNERFQNAVDAISKGEFTTQQLIDLYALTPAQLKSINQ
jgi:hypothetical protein